MAFAQFTYRESLRDMEACLRAMGGKLYYMGFRGRVSRSTLADANDTHDWRIYADFAQVLIRNARPAVCRRSDRRRPRPEPVRPGLEHHRPVPCPVPLGEVPQAQSCRQDDTLLDLHGNIPTFISITGGKVHDVNVLDEILPEAGAFYVIIPAGSDTGPRKETCSSIRRSSTA
jgi:hypothetical protein